MRGFLVSFRGYVAEFWGFASGGLATAMEMELFERRVLLAYSVGGRPPPQGMSQWIDTPDWSSLRN